MTELVIYHDPDLWVSVVDPGDDLNAWASGAARDRFVLAEREPLEGELEVMAAALLTLAEAQQHRETNLYAYVPHAAGPPTVLVDIIVLEPSDGSEEALRELTGADDTDLVEPAGVSRVETALGVAMRSRRYHRQEDSPAVLAALTYGWHLPNHGVDIRLSAALEDLAALAAAEADVDGLAHACRLE